MKEETPTLAEWQQLYDLMRKVKTLAPWQFMTEDMIFGVQNPKNSEFGFVSVMGQLGEHLSIAVYLGAEGLYKFWAVNNEQAPPESILETRHLQASFEDRELVTKEDREVIKKLGLKFRGTQAWPLFRSYRPGYVPWYLSRDEADFLIHVLTQTLDVCQRIRDDEHLLDPPDDITYLVRTPKIVDNQMVWQDESLQVSPPPPRTINLVMNMHLLAQLKKLPLKNQSLAVDFFMTPAQIQDVKGERPYFAYMLLVMDHKSGFVLGTQLLKPEPDLDHVLGKLSLELVNILARVGLRPAKILVQSPHLYNLISDLCKELESELIPKTQLRMVEDVKANLLAFLGR